MAVGDAVSWRPLLTTAALTLLAGSGRLCAMHIWPGSARAARSNFQKVAQVCLRGLLIVDSFLDALRSYSVQLTQFSAIYVCINYYGTTARARFLIYLCEREEVNNPLRLAYELNNLMPSAGKFVI